ncbi:MAG: hypothetical protein KAQ62_17460, partial [Cyclobacteriaceae bacterium]|nr:hypothetical protein [Cyclobacteriaceae bacterium]
MKNNLMKRGVMFVIAVSFFCVAYGQNKEIQKTQLYQHYQMKYIFGNKYNDGEVAKDALYS